MWVCPDLLAVIRHTRRRLPQRSALISAPRVVIQLLGWNTDGTDPRADPALDKLAVTNIVPTAILPYSAAQGIPEDWVGPMHATLLGSPHQPHSAPSSRPMSAAIAWRLYGGGEPQSERIQALTAQLHEDVTEASERLLAARALSLDVHQSPSAWVQRALTRAGIATNPESESN